MNNQPIIYSQPETTVQTPAPVPAAVVTETQPAAQSSSGDGMSVASFVLGLISVIFLPLGTIPGFLGFVLSLDARRRGSSHSLLMAGRVLSLVGTLAIPALYLLMVIVSLLLVAVFAPMM